MFELGDVVQHIDGRWGKVVKLWPKLTWRNRLAVEVRNEYGNHLLWFAESIRWKSPRPEVRVRRLT